MCGPELYLTFERFPDVRGVYVGTFDESDRIQVIPENAKRIFIDAARPDSILMPDIALFGQHATLSDGTTVQPSIFDRWHIVGGRREH